MPPTQLPPHDVWRERGNALFRARAWGDAAAAYTRSLDAQPTAAAAANRAAARLKLVDYEGAAADAGLALSLDPHHLKALERRAAAAAALGRHLAAARDYDAALRLAPGDAPLAKGRAAALAAVAAERGVAVGSAVEVEVVVRREGLSSAPPPAAPPPAAPPPTAPPPTAPMDVEPSAAAAAVDPVTATAADAVALLQRGAVAGTGAAPTSSLPSLRSVADIEAALLRGATAPALERAVVAALAARPPPQLAAALTPALLAAVARAALRVATRGGGGAADAVALLTHVSAAPTFGMAALCLSPGEKAGVAEAWDAAAAAVDGPAAAGLAAVRARYGV